MAAVRTREHCQPKQSVRLPGRKRPENCANTGYFPLQSKSVGFCGWQVTFQIHAVVQEAQYINDVLPLKTTGSEHDEVSAFAPISGNVKRPDIGTDFAAHFDADDRRAGA